jgi:hypothetical protein
MERRRLPKSILVAECECLWGRLEDLELVRVGMKVAGIEVSLGMRV